MSSLTVCYCVCLYHIIYHNKKERKKKLMALIDIISIIKNPLAFRSYFPQATSVKEEEEEEERGRGRGKGEYLYILFICALKMRRSTIWHDQRTQETDKHALIRGNH